ncbi:hypothetical protein [Xanthomonas fragariae]|uniref:hypothetical protein n=1 Tax=Xanthomonas fragariae TaxID=48664 RepID=UPI001EDED647|nr:hypothetical protein [Xanthomonas fragariae]
MDAKQQRGDWSKHLDDAEAEISPQVEDHREGSVEVGIIIGRALSNLSMYASP